MAKFVPWPEVEHEPLGVLTRLPETAMTKDLDEMVTIMEDEQFAGAFSYHYRAVSAEPSVTWLFEWRFTDEVAATYFRMRY